MFALVTKQVRPFAMRDFPNLEREQTELREETAECPNKCSDIASTTDWLPMGMGTGRNQLFRASRPHYCEHKAKLCREGGPEGYPVSTQIALKLSLKKNCFIQA
jgi:hypothetical protein